MNKKAQIWVETVIYTLIGLSILGVLLAVSKPKIESYQDRLIIEQTINSLNEIDSKIYNSLLGGNGNRRIVDLKISKGTLTIDSKEDKLYWVLDSSYKYSEPNLEVPWGKMTVLTSGESSPWKIQIGINYPGIDLTYNGNDNTKELGQAPVPYELIIENLGASAGDKVNINLNAE